VIKKILIALIVFGILIPSISSAATRTMTACTSAAWDTAYNAASAGDTIAFPSGSCSVSLSKTIAKQNLTIQGQGAGTTIVTGGFTISGSSANGLRITGIEFRTGPALNWTGSPSSNLNGLRIDNCKFQNMEYATNFYGAVPTNVVIDNNVFDSITGEGNYVFGNCSATDAFPYTLGTNEGVYFEDNVVQNSTNMRHFIASRCGSRYIIRYNFFNNLYQWDPFDAHDNYEGQNEAGSISWEFYNNVLQYTGTGKRIFHLRGGQGVLWNNYVSGNQAGGIDLNSYMLCENVCTKGATNCRWYPHYVYAWNNKHNCSSLASCDPNNITACCTSGSTWNATASCSGGGSNQQLVEGVDYFNYAMSGYTPYTYPHPLRNETTLYKPIQVSTTNPRYFSDPSGNLIFFSGSHTWNNLQDIPNPYNDPLTDPPPETDYTAYLNALQGYGHNFMRLWHWEQAKGMEAVSDNNIWITPHPFARTGYGTALDGKQKWDVTAFNQSYFDRLRARIIEAGNKGIYVSVMLFNGFSTDEKGTGSGNPWIGHPMNASNNSNEINGDTNGDGAGTEVHRSTITAVDTIWKSYIRKVVDTVNDLDNVVFEICNECDSGSMEWQQAMVTYLKEYELTKPKQHLVGITVNYPGGTNTELLSSNADWISPNSTGGYDTAPPAAAGTKVIISDTDHIFGEGGDRAWAWKTFTRGMMPVFMDNIQSTPAFNSLRTNLGYIKNFAYRIPLLSMTPQTSLCGSTYCLATTASTKTHWLMYMPSTGSSTVNLTAGSGTFAQEWFNPATGATTMGANLTGGASRSVTNPFSNDAVLYVYPTTADTTPPTVTITSPTSASTYTTNVSPLTVAGTASDASGIASVTWANNRGGSGTCTGTTSFTCSSITLYSGSNVITITATDTSTNSNQGTGTLTVTYDNAAPVITNTTSTPITCTGSPMNVTITATTNEAATCRYSVSDLGYPSMTTAMSTTGGTSHSQSINLSCGTSYTYYVSCIDALGNANTAANNAAIAFTIGSTPDTTAPVIISASPNGKITCTSNPQDVTITVTTDENATCKWDITDTTYALMANTFTTTGTTSHSTVRPNLLCVDYLYGYLEYPVYIRCKDTSDNANLTSTAITFYSDGGPVLTSISPSGTLTCTTNPLTTTLTFQTHVPATCRYHPTETIWDNMDTMSSTGGIIVHSQLLSKNCGSTYHYNLLCRDGSNNQSFLTPMSFSINAAVAPPENIQIFYGGQILNGGGLVQ